MATQRLVNTNFWRDSYVVNLDPAEKLLFLYFLTNPATTLAGVYEIDIRLVALDTGYDKDMITKMLGRFCKDGKMYYEKGWLILTNFVKHQRLNPSIKLGIEKAILELPKWLQDKISLEVDESKQISLLTSDEIQSDTSLGTDSPQKKLIKATTLKAKEKEAKPMPAASEFLINDSSLAAKEKAAKTRKPNGDTKPINEIVRDRLKKKGLAV